MAATSFGWIDYTVVGGTLLFSILIGVYYAVFAKQETQDLLIGGRKMGIAPIAASMLVTYLSAITVIGYPAEIYAYGIQIFMSAIVFVLFVPLSVYFTMSVFYDMKLTSVYEYLEYRYRSPWVRWFASAIFIIQMSFFMGVCLYAPSIALQSFMGLKVWQSVVGLGLCATVYTSIGGLRAVVWTDVFQLIMLMAGLFSIIIHGFVVSGGITETFRRAEAGGRLKLFETAVDPFMRHNTLNFILGQGFTIVCLYGTHQPQVQRYCSLPSFRHAVKAVVFAVPLNVFTVALCLVSGIVVFSTYADCDPRLLGKIKVVDQIVPFFVKDQLGFMPGMMGLFTACVFSASLSTISSGLNSIAAVVWEDFLVRIPCMNKLGEHKKANIVRFIALAFGVISILLAFIAEHMGNILAATITALGALSGPLGMVFFMGLLMPFINKTGALTGMTTGFCIMIWITTGAFITKKSHIPLPFSVDGCLDEFANYTLSRNLTTIPKFPSTNNADLEWPTKLYTLSYILYPFVGGMITMIVGIIASLLSGGVRNMKNVEDEYLHPLVRKNKKFKSKARDSELQTMNSLTPPSSPVCYYDPLCTAETFQEPEFNKPLMHKIN